MASQIADATAQTKSHWETIQQWRIDEGKNFERSRSTETTRMAASGMKKGTPQWEANLAAIDAVNAKEKASQAGSATQGILDNWTKDMKEFYVNAAVPGELVAVGGPKSPGTLPRKESGPTGSGKNMEPGFSYADQYAGWERMGKKARSENNMTEAPPKTYEEAVDRAVASGNARYTQTPEARELERQEQPNVFTDSGMTQAQFEGLSTEEFMVSQFGYSDAYSEFTAAPGSEAAAAIKTQKEADDRRTASAAPTQQASPWWA